MKGTAEVTGEESKTRRALARTWLVLRWILFLPAGLLVAWMGLLLLYVTSVPGNAAIIGAAAVLAASIGVSMALSPVPLVGAALMGLATLVIVFTFFRGDASLLWAWAGGVVAFTTIGFVRSRVAAKKNIKPGIKDARWLLFLPAAFVAGSAAVMVAALSWETLMKAAGFSTSANPAVHALMGFAVSFLGSAVFILVTGLVAPSQRAVVMLLVANLSYFVVLSMSDDFSGWKTSYGWLLGTAFGCILVLLKTTASREEPGRTGGAVEGRGRRYKGTAPYQDLDLDRKTFFGRERESRHFLNLVLAERLVVLFAKSGMGKSSLINASILEPLRSNGYFPFVVRFNDPGQEPLRSLIEGVRRAAKDAGVDMVGGEETSAWRFFKTAEFWSHRDDLLRPVLVLDQFEELFTLHGSGARKEFTTQLAELVRGRGSTNRDAVSEASASSPRQPVDDTAPEMKIVIALREDFLANLEDLSAEIPAILHNRFRLGPLSAQAARDAIVEPASLPGDTFETGRFSYQKAAVERIISFLAKRRLGADRVEEQEVEPVQLQLICHYLEETVRARQTAQKGEAEIQISEADLGGEEQMQQVLEGFYDRTIGSVRPRRKGRAVRRLCEQRLISASSRRLTEDEEEIQRRYKISGELLRQLVDARLLRAEPRLGGTTYEVSHDRLVEPIQKSRKRRITNRIRIAAASVPLFLTLTISVGWKTFERQHKETQIRADLLERNALKAIQSTEQLASERGFDHTDLLKMAGPVLNPSTFAIFTRPDMDAWKWSTDARTILDHIRRAYPTFLVGSVSSGEEEKKSARILVGAIVSTLDHARMQADIDPGAAKEADNLRREILEAFRNKFHPSMPVSWGSETSVLVEANGRAPFRIQQILVTSTEYSRLVGAQMANQSKGLTSGEEVTVNWYEAACFAALCNGRLPSSQDLISAEGKITKKPGEWLQNDEQRRIGRHYSLPGNNPFRVVWPVPVPQ